MSQFEIGTSYGSLTAFGSLGTALKEPGKTSFYDATKIVRTGDGNSKALGFPSCTMYWNALTRSQRDQLRFFCQNESATAYIKIPSNDAFSTYTAYSCIMHWPITEKWQAMNVIEDLEIKFTNLVVATS